MITYRKLLKFLPSSLYSILYRQYVRHRTIKGIPEGIDLKTLDKLCLDQFGEALRHVSYVHISGWKTSGAYRLLLLTNTGRRWSLVYKNAHYSEEYIPAVTGLPVMPGPPEFFVYKNGQARLAKYLPKVHVCLEIIPGLHYRYLLEDMKPEYRAITDSKGLITAAGELHELHATLCEWVHVAGQDPLLRYDRKFSAALMDYARINLGRYAQATADRSVLEVVKTWPQISRVHQREEFYEYQSIRPIHGDYNLSNIHFPTNGANTIKIVDWEWAGMGVPHSDLVSLLKGINSGIERQALEKFSEQDNKLSLNEHTYLYRWCQLERGLLDGAFLAKQQMDSSSKVKWIPGYIRSSMQTILHAYHELK